MILTRIPFTISADELFSQLHLDPAADYAGQIEQLVAQAADLANPKALFKVAYVESCGTGTVVIDGITFTSRALQANLQDVHRVFAYVTTCGTELDALRSRYADDTLLLYCLDWMKTAALKAANRHLVAFIKERYELTKIAQMNPGSGDASVWPIEQQKQLFRLIGRVEEQIGVELTPTCLMEPNKSTSGIIYPTATEFVNCALCQRRRCPNRRAPFDARLWRQKMGEEVEYPNGRS
ncbi:MAG TPA: vitamin B12 dependent methionine synthase [Firmicutes bacterium]|jgi:hypothetical protein|nr:vitamin B12 dependent methionine synthase [Bacillota bacterium]